MKPPAPYFGSKARVADWIVSLLPEHGHYVEPFCGGLSVLLAKPQAAMETVNDLREDEHRALAAALADCRASAVLSGYHSPLYDELYADWHRYERSTMTGNAISDKGRTEVVWANRPLGTQRSLFDEEIPA